MKNVKVELIVNSIATEIVAKDIKDLILMVEEFLESQTETKKTMVLFMDKTINEVIEHFKFKYKVIYSSSIPEDEYGYPFCTVFFGLKTYLGDD